MPRVKLEIDRDKLVAAINTVESDADNPPKNHSDLFKRVAEHLGLASVGSVAGRIKDYGLLETLKTKPGRVVSNSGESQQPKKRGGANPGLVLIDCEPFIRRGLRIETLADLLTSSNKDVDINKDIVEATREVRSKWNVPKMERSDYDELLSLVRTEMDDEEAVDE